VATPAYKYKYKYKFKSKSDPSGTLRCPAVACVHCHLSSIYPPLGP